MVSFNRIVITALTLYGTTQNVVSFSPLSKNVGSTTTSPTSSSLTRVDMIPAGIARKAAIGTAAAVVGTVGFKKIFDKASRKYEEGSVAREYDAWTEDGILEYYWGEHIHLGYYSQEEMEAGYKKKNFIQAKYDFIDEMMKFGGIDTLDATNANEPIKVLDVGCGFGGTSRYIAKNLGPNSHVTGITLSPNQVMRGTELAVEQNVPNVNFTVMNALAMDFPDNSFDVVWACESGEHMPDKKLYIDEMMRVLKPGGKYVMATWCQRDDRKIPFDKRDERDLKFLYEEWTHPYFISIESYDELIQDTGVMGPVKTANWVEETIASWRHSIWVGVYDPMGWILKPRKYMKTFRDGYCLERMHRAFKRGLMEYGMFAATKNVPVVLVEKEGKEDEKTIMEDGTATVAVTDIDEESITEETTSTAATASTAATE